MSRLDDLRRQENERKEAKELRRLERKAKIRGFFTDNTNKSKALVADVGRGLSKLIPERKPKVEVVRNDNHENPTDVLVNDEHYVRADLVPVAVQKPESKDIDYWVHQGKRYYPIRENKISESGELVSIDYAGKQWFEAEGKDFAYDEKGELAFLRLDDIPFSRIIEKTLHEDLEEKSVRGVMWDNQFFIPAAINDDGSIHFKGETYNKVELEKNNSGGIVAIKLNGKTYKVRRV